MNGPLISVIIPTFNRSLLLQRAINSVLKQTYENFELIIVDDGSTDNTSEIVKDIIKRKTKQELVYIEQKNEGVSSARNNGVRRSRGEWIAFLDSDDEWLVKKLELQVNFIKNNANHWVHGEEVWIRNGKRVNQKKIHQKSGGDIFRSSLALCLVSPSTVMIHRELFIISGGFNEEFIVCEDYDLWLRLALEHEVGFIKDPLINKYGGHEDQLSQKFKAMDYWRVKSMFQILQSRKLSESKRSILLNVLQRKSHILLNGYEKHNNMKNYDEVLSWLEYSNDLCH